MRHSRAARAERRDDSNEAQQLTSRGPVEAKVQSLREREREGRVKGRREKERGKNGERTRQSGRREEEGVRSLFLRNEGTRWELGGQKNTG